MEDTEVSISNRLIIGFGIVIALLVVLGFYGVSQIERVRDTTGRIVSRDLAMIREVATVSDAQAEMRAYREDMLRDALASRGAPGSIGENERLWRQALGRTTDALRRADALAEQFSSDALSSERSQAWARQGALLDELNAELLGIQSASERQFASVRNGDLSAALAQEDELIRHRGEFARLVREVHAVADEGVELGQERIGAVYNESRISTFIAILVALAIGIIVTFLLRRSIIAPVQRFMAFVERVGRGDLSGEPAITGTDEIGRLGVTLNAMVESLKQIAVQNREANANLGAAIAEIRASSQEQAAGVEEQLAAVQETAATVDEITHAGAQVTKRAQEVIAAAQTTAQTSADGLRAVDETARVMDAIREQAEIVARNIVALSEKTQAIGDIISTVNDVSERSHLLALNAAIEAAAAGESGRSFAVVASEMKVLADQAKDATVQVRSILGDVQRGINTSVMLTEEAVKRVVAGKERTEITQRTIGEITSRVQEGALTFQQIVASTNQQQLGIEQVMSALQNIRQASQQTAAGTRQLNEAAGNLATLSQQLQALADRYKI
ncbi:methyl-accepting chemotaxis protein [Terricaulis sp.]|uniref:methyl-accepting chemotaxis protein n=1 Tax=Terricaulis sp. TaxID=2768686 RepID=UPI002AC597B4|nr:methyl-accepting chemotaxis protein [Terricaulis sp.]MDZ4692981.1 methyl-accepting chemotaxis protein [Terricaulis sp.]